MQNLLLYAVTVAYAVQAGVYACNGKWSLTLILAGYTIANAGLIWGASH